VSDLVIAKARLRRDTPIAAIAPLLVPADSDQRARASHQLVWSLYTDGPDRQRDFLWRQTGDGELLMLGQRPPVDRHSLFDLEQKPFAPVLRVGQRLAFKLRANATRDTHDGQRVDVVMHALHRLPHAERAAQRRARNPGGQHSVATASGRTVWVRSGAGGAVHREPPADPGSARKAADAVLGHGLRR
jgi:CRISPR system Cascade subunit CasE